MGGGVREWGAGGEVFRVIQLLFSSSKIVCLFVTSLWGLALCVRVVSFEKLSCKVCHAIGGPPHAPRLACAGTQVSWSSKNPRDSSDQRLQTSTVAFQLGVCGNWAPSSCAMNVDACR